MTLLRRGGESVANNKIEYTKKKENPEDEEESQVKNEEDLKGDLVVTLEGITKLKN